MNARDVMTTAVISVRLDTPTREIAKLLSDKGISAVPVLDSTGAPIGMISEGDLIGRDEAAREARRDWWLTLLAEGEELNPQFLATLHAPKRTARDVMVSPVITANEDTEISDIAKLLATHRIKRVPVLRDGRVVGIVSRADLVRALAMGDVAPTPARTGGGGFGETLAGLDERFLHRHRRQDEGPQPAASAEIDANRLNVSDFRALVADHEHKRTTQQQEQREALDQQRSQHVAELIHRHISDTGWRSLVQHARQAAEQGEKEFMLLQFPAALCSDGGRAINSYRPEWPETLRGEAAELYSRWESDMKPHGFELVARVLDFPGGMLGDVGLFLVWAA
jgi:CBS domain-containing protein